MKKWLTVLGGAHSGKTDLVAQVCGDFAKVAWWGTAVDQPQDSDWQERLDSLRKNRSPDWTTFDGPWAWPPSEKNTALQQAQDSDLFVMDCLNLWLAAHIHRGMSLYSMAQLKVHLELEFTKLVNDLSGLPCAVVVVSAEVGMGVVPSGDAGRLFRDLLTRWNRQIVGHSDSGVSVQAGRAFLWPAGRAVLPDDGAPVRCVQAPQLSRLLRGL